MVKACLNAMARGSSEVIFVLPGYARGNTRRMFGDFGPTGQVVADTGTDEKPGVLVAFDVVKTLAYLRSKGVVNAQVIDSGRGGKITITRKEGDGP